MPKYWKQQESLQKRGVSGSKIKINKFYLNDSTEDFVLCENSALEELFGDKPKSVLVWNNVRSILENW